MAAIRTNGVARKLSFTEDGSWPSSEGLPTVVSVGLPTHCCRSSTQSRRWFLNRRSTTSIELITATQTGRPSFEFDGREAVIRLVLPRPRHQCRKRLHELHARHHDVRGSVAPRRVQPQPHLPGSVALHALIGQRTRAGDVRAMCYSPRRQGCLDTRIRSAPEAAPSRACPLAPFDRLRTARRRHDPGWRHRPRAARRRRTRSAR